MPRPFYVQSSGEAGTWDDPCSHQGTTFRESLGVSLSPFPLSSTGQPFFSRPRPCTQEFIARRRQDPPLSGHMHLFESLSFYQGFGKFYSIWTHHHTYILIIFLLFFFFPSSLGESFLGWDVGVTLLTWGKAHYILHSSTMLAKPWRPLRIQMA